MNPPQTKKVDFNYSLHGMEVIDYYQWLEETDDEVESWVEQQNEFANNFFSDTNHEKLTQELLEFASTGSFTVPFERDGCLYWSEYTSDQDHMDLYRQRPDEDPEVILDVNGMSDDGSVGLVSSELSPGGKYLIYVTDKHGNEIGEVKIKNLDTREDLAETESGYAYPSFAWLEDESGYYYTRPVRSGNLPENEQRLHNKVYFHKLHTDFSEDKLIAGQDFDKNAMISLQLSNDEDNLIITLSIDWETADLLVLDTATGETSSITDNVSAQFEITVASNGYYALTDWQAPRYRVLFSEDINQPTENWQEVVAESEAVIESVTASSDKLLITKIHNVSAELYSLQLGSNQLKEIQIEDNSTITGVRADYREPEFFYGISNMLNKHKVYDSNNQLHRKHVLGLDSSEFHTEQRWATGSDVKVPYFIVGSKQALSQPSPTILYAYGGFDISLTPRFHQTMLPWLKRDYLFVIANARGGGEFGSAWHKDGKLANKQHTFDDTIAVAEELTNTGATTSDMLGVMGGSNGGLTVAACIVQRPDLFGAAASVVPLVDMFRFRAFLIADRWKSEYGDPEVEQEFNWIKEWNPYYNASADADYPPLLLQTAMHDTRVHPMHAFKFSAKLQDWNNEVYLDTELESGHQGSNIRKDMESRAKPLAFFESKLSRD